MMRSGVEDGQRMRTSAKVASARSARRHSSSRRPSKYSWVHTRRGRTGAPRRRTMSIASQSKALTEQLGCQRVDADAERLAVRAAAEKESSHRNASELADAAFDPVGQLLTLDRSPHGCHEDRAIGQPPAQPERALARP